MKTKVALTTGNNRSENIRNAINLIEKDIDLSGRSNVFIKVNFVDTEIQAAATHAESVRVLLEILRKRYNGKITIGESCIQGPVIQAFQHFGYLDMLKEYKVDILDMKEGEWEILHLYNSEFKRMDIHYSKQMLESDYLISICPPKTHDQVIVTLSIKNVVMGGPSHKYDDKIKIHQGPQVMNLDLYLMAIEHLPELSIIDGYVGMEGDGPVLGDPFEWKIAVAGCNAVTVDSFTSSLMGFAPQGVGYLYYLAQKGYGTGDLSKMQILGEKPESHLRQFNPHPQYERQKKWPDERVNKILGV
ncbi:DUF362 domain-containing protein [bacterium]|nr:MAG: DUF362 domain-containing protein [bacterium]